METPRKTDGKYDNHPRCDGCGKPTLDYCTDDLVCGGNDTPGFVVCERKRCDSRVTKAMAGAAYDSPEGIERRRALYTRQRAENDQAREEGRPSKTVPPEGNKADFERGQRAFSFWLDWWTSEWGDDVAESNGKRLANELLECQQISDVPSFMGGWFMAYSEAVEQRKKSRLWG